MNETIIAAIISAFSAIIVCVINSNSQNKKILTEMDKHNELQAYQIKELTNQVEKHNRVIERVYNLETKEAVMEKELKVANHRIDDLEVFHK